MEKKKNSEKSPSRIVSSSLRELHERAQSSLKEKAVKPAAAALIRPKPIRISLKEAASGGAPIKRVSAKPNPAAVRVTGPVYSYIYDTFVQEMKYVKLIRELENRLVDLGISGRTHRLSCFKNLREIVKEDAARGVKTIVVLGNDETLIRAVDAAGETDAVLGMIPFGTEKENRLAKILGLGFGTLSCDILSARLLQKIDLGLVNGHYFLTNIDIPAADFFVNCDDKYKLSFLKSADIRICNFLGWQEGGEEKLISNPSDGLLETVAYAKSAGFLDGMKNLFKEDTNVKKLSVFYNKKIEVVGEAPFAAWVDGRKVLNKKLEITVVPAKLKIIVGRGRQI